MKKRLTITGSLLAIIFTLLYLLESSFGSKDVDPLAILKISGTAALITFICYMVFNYFLWSLPPIQKILKIPIIKGVWIADIPPINQQGETLFVQLKIKQTFDSISLTLKSDQFISESLICRLIQDSSGSYLYFVYISKPRKKYFNIHQVHRGTFRLHCQDLTLIGEFYTSNFLGGNVEFYRRGLEPGAALED